MVAAYCSSARPELSVTRPALHRLLGHVFQAVKGGLCNPGSRCESPSVPKVLWQNHGPSAGRQQRLGNDDEDVTLSTRAQRADAPGQHRSPASTFADARSEAARRGHRVSTAASAVAPGHPPRHATVLPFRTALWTLWTRTPCGRACIGCGTSRSADLMRKAPRARETGGSPGPVQTPTLM